MSKEIPDNKIDNSEISDKIKEKIKNNLLNLDTILKTHKGFPEGIILDADIDLKSGNIKHYFIKDKDGNIIKFADLRKNDKFLRILKEYFRESYIDEIEKPLTDSEIDKYIDALADIYLAEEANYES